ncbi:MAG: diaminopimelate dehydrogenase [Coriobacteriia bacterium]|nr:diaminopimelate dehydrogenase [Coriobacteriia bacterium]MCL2749955.1 diaminopimelate dehydrogenase [Coriobacteriia bacterium]
MIRVGIVGYGNIGRGVEKAVLAAEDMELCAVFSRRDPEGIKLALSTAPVLHVDEAPRMTDEIDVMILCGGSATDLAEQGPYFASLFNTVCSYDTHAKIPEYLAAVDAATNDTTAVISTGWDPGLFSMMRALFEAVLPNGGTYTFWGKGVSQGHSDAIRRIEGVEHAIQYTVPLGDAINMVRSGVMPQLTTRQKHLRECFVVAEAGADKAAIEETIKTMPNYFAEYNTVVHFIEMDELLAKHSAMPHGGMVLRSGVTGDTLQGMEFSLTLDSNPEFTGSVMTAYARAAFRMANENLFGAKTVFDVPLAYISPTERAELIKELL